MSVKELFLPEDSRIDRTAGLDSKTIVQLKDFVKSSLWISVAVLITVLLSNLV